MLSYLELKHVGPAPEMRLDFRPRLNILTGDNSLGKTFVLDVAWWALTQTWPGKPEDEKKTMAWPLPGRRKEAAISFAYAAKTVDVPHESVFDAEKEVWPPLPGRPGAPGLVLYLRIDGGFSLWDPARNYWKRLEARGPDRPKSFDFDMEEIWDGLRSNGNVFCEGADRRLEDVEGPEWAGVSNAVRRIARAGAAPARGHPAGGFHAAFRGGRAGDSGYPHAVRRDRPVTLASAGMKRVLALAYLIVWAYTKHVNACKLLGTEPTDRFTVLIDEVELHLHPQWQRTLLPAVLEVIEDIGRGPEPSPDAPRPKVQIIASTHAPLVMASVEPRFNEATDKIFHFAIEDGRVKVEALPWAAQGDAVGWLVSEVFGLEQARSREAEQAIEAAEAFYARRNGRPAGGAAYEGSHTRGTSSGAPRPRSLLAAVGGQDGATPMIYVAPVPEPPAFGRRGAGQKGNAWLLENPTGESAWLLGAVQAPARGGFLTSCAGMAPCTSPMERWIITSLRANPDVSSTNGATTASVPRGSTAVKKSVSHPGEMRVLDPFEVQGWLVRNHAAVLAVARQQQLYLSRSANARRFTLLRLHLRDDERVLRQRRHWMDEYERTGDIGVLERNAPLLARAVKQQKDGKGPSSGQPITQPIDEARRSKALFSSLRCVFFRSCVPPCPLRHSHCPRCAIA